VRVATFYTNKGEMEFELFSHDAPNTVAYFCDLVTKDFYNDTIIHKYVPETLIQGGCPIGDGTGYPGYLIKCELNGDRQKHDRGVLSMAHAGRNGNGSQFFICLEQNNVKHLDGNHTCFGKLRAKGVDVLPKLRRFDVIERIELRDISDNYDDLDKETSHAGRST